MGDKKPCAPTAAARASLLQARVNLTYTTIVSPIDGVVISRNVDVGQTVAASLQAPTLFTIAEDLAKMQVHTSVAEADIGRVRPEMPVSFTVDAYPGELFPGVVNQIRNAPQTVQNVVTYNVVVEVQNREQKLKPGMTADMTFVYAETGEVLRVPNAALRFRPPPEMLARAGLRGSGGGPQSPEKADIRRVWVLRDGEPRPLRLRVGISDGTHTEVIDGDLREGDELVLQVAGGSKPAPGGSGLPRGPGPGGRGVLRRL